MDIDCCNYRLRLGLPVLSRPFFWLPPDGAGSESLSFLFDPPTEYCLALPQLPSLARLPSCRLPCTHPSHTNGCRTTIAPADAQDSPTLGMESPPLRMQRDFQNGDNFLYQGDQVQELDCRIEVKLSDLWLHAGRSNEGQPRQLHWEVTHELEEIFGTRSSPAITDKIELGRRTREATDPVAGKGKLRPTQFISDSIQESELVRAALCALQGVSTAVSWLEQLAAAFSSTAADNSSQYFTTLATRSSSSCSLSNVLAEFAEAGRVACQLDFFTSFFLNQQTDPHEDGTSGTHNLLVANSRRKRKRLPIITERNIERPVDSPPEIWEDLEDPDISPHCHTNQAFATAVRTFIRGNLVSLNTMISSVNHRRNEALGELSVELSELPRGETGLVFGFGCGDLTLMELFLHSHKQREQLQALATLCRIDKGASLESSLANVFDENIGFRVATEDVKMKGSAVEMTTYHFSASSRAIKEFPRGADLLTYLFDKLLGADILHLELMRFLFEQACQPYTVFIRSWLYHATVQDPFGEFFVKAVPPTCLRKSFGEQEALLSYQVTNGVPVPCFLEEVCIPLLRAGQQLQVLSKLMDNWHSVSKTVDLSSQITGSFQDALPIFSRWSDILIRKSTLDGPVPVFSNKGNLGVVQQPKRCSQMLKGFHDVSHTAVAKSPLPQEETKASEVMKGAVASSAFQLTCVEEMTQQKACTEGIQGANSNFYRESVLGAAVLGDDIPDACPTRSESSLSLLQVPILMVDKRKELLVSQNLKSKLLNQESLLNSVSDTSFILNFPRGTGWPIMSLPKYPFPTFADEVDASFGFTSTMFPSCNGCWDVNRDFRNSYSVTDTRIQLSHGVQDWTAFEPKFSLNRNNQEVDVDHSLWFSNQRTLGLTDQMLHAEYEKIGAKSANEHGSTYSLGCQGWGCRVRVQSSNAVLQQHAGKRLLSNPQWNFVDSLNVDAFGKRYFVDNFLLRKKYTGVESVSPFSCCGVDDLYGKHNVLPETQVLEVEDGNSQMSLDVWDSNVLPSTKTSRLVEIKLPAEEKVSENGVIGLGACHGSLGKWETYIHSAYQRFVDIELPQHSLSCEENEDNDNEIPLAVAVKQCIVDEILYQYKCTSMLTMRLLQNGLHLQDHFIALRRYYFMERGDWAEYFLSALCKNEWNCQGGQPQLLEVQRLLGTALQSSSCDGDEYAERLYIRHCRRDDHLSDWHNQFFGFPKHQRPVGTFVDCNKLEAFDFIKVGYKVDWPLSLIITPSALSLYSSIFTFLLRMKLTVTALGDIWRNLQYLFVVAHKDVSHVKYDIELRKGGIMTWLSKRIQVIGCSLNQGSQLSDYHDQNKKFRTLQLFRQHIGHVVITIQRYMESQLLHVVWSKFLNAVENEVNDIQDFEKMHSVYLDNAYHQCFLSRDMEDAKTCIDVILQCTLDFRFTLLTASREQSGSFVSVDDIAFHKVLEVKTVFEVHLEKLFSYQQRSERQYSILLSDFWMCLDYNGCLKVCQPFE